MKKKVYESLTGIHYTFPVNVNGKTVWISISGDQGEFSTFKEDVQEAIENHAKFLNGEIGISSGNQAPEEKAPEVTPSEFPDVVDINDAVSILRKDPYKVAASKLKSKESVLAIAQELGVSFPNLSVN
jgi:hypothetical protein